MQVIPAIIDIPHWMLDPQQPTHKSSREVRELTELTYTSFFETALDKMAQGETLSTIVREDERNLDLSRFRSWIHRDPERQARYYEAQAIGAGRVEDEMLDIADSKNETLEDVQRSTLRINTRKWLLGVWNRKRYGSTHSIDVTNNKPQADHLEVLAERLTKLKRGEVVDVESRDVDDVDS